MEAEKQIIALADENKATVLRRFFKTQKGEYGYGDCFLGVTVPQIRAVAKSYRELPLGDVEMLLKSVYHEVRMLGVLILVARFKKSPEEIYNFYLANKSSFNNWDLVDLSAPKIVGEYMWLTGGENDDWLRPEVAQLVKGSLWDQRIAMVSTLGLIRHNVLDPTFGMAPRFLNHPHDLMHKATGWMLREAGKRDEQRLKEYLDSYATQMPRTMLRYAIEKLSKEDYLYYLKLK